jgi:hypothetical protein
MASALRLIRIYFEYLASTFLWTILNPFGLRQMLLQISGQITAIIRGLAKGSAAANDNPVILRLPFDGWWKVHNGGVTKSSSHSWNIISQRYAYDFVIVDESDKSFQGNPKYPGSYFAFGQPVLAAADGVVVEARDGIRDYSRAGTGWIDWRTRDIRGNYVIIEHQGQRYTLYAHLQAKSICVKTSELVKAGQVIGRCGHSGHSTEPHLHFQLQDKANFFTAIGLPACFSRIERKTNERHSQYVESGYIERDQRVRNATSDGREGIVEKAALAKPGIGDLVKIIVISLFTVLGILAVIARLVELVVGIL